MSAHFGVFAFGLFDVAQPGADGHADMVRRMRVEQQLKFEQGGAGGPRPCGRATAELESLNTDLRREIGVRHEAEVRTLMQLERLELLRRIARHRRTPRPRRASSRWWFVSVEEHLPADFAALCNYQRDTASGGPALVVTRVGARSEQLALELAMTEEARMN